MEKADKMKYVRTVIENPKKIVSKIIVTVKVHVAIDREAKQQSRSRSSTLYNTVTRKELCILSSS